ncbi:MAG: hypothetical protein FJY92_12620, partial [Candidatus Hydrogenedentes bacterium]|nr:hypothetical protein [Candidatus Hydrogenedentota bacterium]
AVPNDNYSAYPQLVHTLFASAPGPLERNAGEIVWTFGALLCVAAGLLAARIGGAECACVAPAIVATSPLFLDQCGAPGIDVPYTATAIGAMLALAAWRQDARAGWLVLAGVLAGSGHGIRHTSLLVNALLVVGVAILATQRRAWNVSIFCAAAAASAAPWLVRTALVAGNPVYPFFSSVLGAGAAPDVDVAAFGAHSSIQGRGMLQLLVFPWSLTMQPAHYGGWSTSPGALWLVLGVVGVAVGGRGARLLGAFSGVGLAALFFFQRFARYAFPFIAPMMVVAALPHTKLPKLRGLMGAVLCISYLLGLAPAMAGAAMKLPAALGIEPRGPYLARRIERYEAMVWAARELPPGAVVLSLDPRGYYFDRRTMTNFEVLKELTKGTPDEQREWLAENGIRYVFYPGKYVDESPGFGETGVGAMAEAWRADGAHFRLIKEFDLACPRDGGTERVEIYECRR